jgi:hypothetical protein
MNNHSDPVMVMVTVMMPTMVMIGFRESTERK